VTGGTGFIGSHTIECLAEAGHKAVVLGRRPPALPARDCHFAFADIRDYEAVSEAVSKVDAVIHLAGLVGIEESIVKPEQFIEANVLGAINVFDACRFFDKTCVFPSVGNVKEDNNLYAISKFTAERLALMYNKEHGTRIFPIQLFNVYGERQRVGTVQRLVPSALLAALKDRPITVFEDGRQCDDFVYVRDVARILTSVLTVGRFEPGKVYHLGTGRGLPVLDVVRRIIHMTGSKSKVIVTGQHRTGEGARPQSADPALLPVPAFEFTPLEAGLARTIDYFRSVAMASMAGVFQS
jgi:nucleoside-diphosphate-sugar epimerase